MIFMLSTSLYGVPISWDRDNRVDFTAPFSKSIFNDLNKVVIVNSQPSWCTPSGVGLENTPDSDFYILLKIKLIISNYTIKFS